MPHGPGPVPQVPTSQTSIVQIGPQLRTTRGIYVLPPGPGHRRFLKSSQGGLSISIRRMTGEEQTTNYTFSLLMMSWTIVSVFGSAASSSKGLMSHHLAGLNGSKYPVRRQSRVRQFSHRYFPKARLSSRAKVQYSVIPSTLKDTSRNSNKYQNQDGGTLLWSLQIILCGCSLLFFI